MSVEVDVVAVERPVHAVSTTLLPALQQAARCHTHTHTHTHSNCSLPTIPRLGDNGVAHINEVDRRRARLVLRWVTVRRYTVLVRNQATRLSRFSGTRNEHRPKCGDVLHVAGQ